MSGWRIFLGGILVAASFAMGQTPDVQSGLPESSEPFRQIVPRNEANGQSSSNGSIQVPGLAQAAATAPGGPGIRAVVEMAEFDIPVANQTRQSVTGNNRSAQSPEGVRHAEWTESTCEIDTAVVPEETRPLRLPGTSLKPRDFPLKGKAATGPPPMTEIAIANETAKIQQAQATQIPAKRYADPPIEAPVPPGHPSGNLGQTPAVLPVRPFVSMEPPNLLDGKHPPLLENNHHEIDHTFTAEVEYMLLFQKGSHPTVPIFSRLDGTLGDSLGDTDPRQGPLSGGHLTFGYWQIEDNPWAPQGSLRTLGLEARFTFLGSGGADFRTDVPPDLFRPFFDLNDRTVAGFLVASPGVATGEIDAHSHLSIWGAEANVWKNVYFDEPGTTYAVDLMAGLRYLNAESDLDINSISVFNNTISAGSPYASFAGNRLQVADSFDVRNRFYGGQVGIKTKRWIMECMSIESSLRVAFGATQQDVTVNGSQVRTFADGTTARSEGGLLALPSNIGTRHDVKFSQVPEGNLKALWPIGDQFMLSLGFSVLYWNRVARAADQIDRSLDITQIPNYPAAAGATPTGLGRPSVPFTQSDMWVLGLTFAVEYRW